MFSDPTFWAAIGTLILVVSAARPVARLLGGMLDKRSAQIKATLDEATNLREEAQHLLAEYKRKQQTAAKDAEEIVAHARDEAARIAEHAVENLEVSLKRREAGALERIAQAEAEALKQVRDATIDIAVAATGKLIADSLDDARSDILIEESTAEVTRRFN